MVKCLWCKSRNIVGVEYAYGHPDRVDGISEWRCTDCGLRVGRWSHKVLCIGEWEPRYGKIKK